ncbi:hypothetical protein QVD17_18253 [Tagetes erecta]|uniref:Uncharacterized protein n=1 Tax=Tagetes erecta TaxID=13708 RepID=A0AAD8KK99_TARER|nr:hypothetical protein QVD17_18253 [Tagetes erecta]
MTVVYWRWFLYYHHNRHVLAMVSGSGGGDGPMEMVAVPWVRVAFSLPGDVCDDGGGTIGLNPVDDVDFQICVVVGAIGCGFSLKRAMMIMSFEKWMLV